MAALGLGSVGCEQVPETASGPESRPNILLIVADDMGYSDIGAFGGDVETPNLDALAARGIRATNFTVNPTCSPTRASLLTGADNHVAGFGNMDEFVGPAQEGQPGYEGYLNDRVVTVASVLRDAGYHTYYAGKWHLGYEPSQWPSAEGFERDFTLLQGGGSNWSDMMYPDPTHPRVTVTRNGQLVDSLPEGHFSSEAYSGFLMQSIDENREDGKPFFAFLSFQAVHSPFAAPDDWLDRYSGRYDAGYDAIREQRLARMREMGIVGQNVTAAPRLPTIPAWDELSAEEQQLSARKMEVYAAMLANMDFHIGRVLDHLEEIGQLDNTVVIFMSDNGAEFIELADLVSRAFSPEAKAWLEQNFDMRPESWGRVGSVADYGPPWAWVGMTPFRMFKAYTTEGGIRSPLIIAGPGVEHQGDMTDAVLHVTDIVPTVLDLAGAEHPSSQPGSQVAPIDGKSMRPLLAGTADAVRTESDWIGWELFGNRALRQGDWKLVSLVEGAGGTGDWQLFNLREDPAELRDLSQENPAKRDELAALWDEYARKNGVVLTGDGAFAPPSAEGAH
jgi:arylsulfatase